MTSSASARPPAFARADIIERTLELVGERGVDPTPQVYERLFAMHPQMQAHFWRDTTGAIRGEMLSRTFEAILDFVGERKYAGHMIGTEMVTHEGYDVPREIFATFFGVVADTLREILADDWTAEIDSAWRDLLAEIDGYANRTPRSDVTAAAFTEMRQAFEARGGAA